MWNEAAALEREVWPVGRLRIPLDLNLYGSKDTAQPAPTTKHEADWTHRHIPVAILLVTFGRTPPKHK